MIALPSRYTLKSVVPGGAMSDTLLCCDQHLGRDVIIKSLKPGVEPYRLMDELTALAAIRSKHVVQVFDVVRAPDGSVIGFVEEYIDGGPVVFAPPGISPVDAMRLIYPIAVGVAEVHSHGRVHRDLKPDNMRYDSGGTLKIFDFGLAKIDGAIGTSSLWFTAGYSAPEIFQKDSTGKHNFTKAVDVFAFGATACWLLNGGALPGGLMSVPPTLPCFDFASLTVSLPAPVTSLLNLCLAANSGLRPSMDEVCRVLSKTLLAGSHRMLLTYGSTEYRLDASNTQASLSANGGSVQIKYDGMDFLVTAVSGPVLINNLPVKPGYVMSGSTVIVLGAQGGQRTSVTADISHPEVIL